MNNLTQWVFLIAKMSQLYVRVPSVQAINVYDRQIADNNLRIIYTIFFPLLLCLNITKL